MVDKIKPLKLEDPGDGGDETDLFPTAMNPNEDYVDCRGVVIQGDATTDENVVISRDSSGNLTMKDAATGSFTLGQLVFGGLDKIILDVAGGLVYDNEENFVTKS